MEFNNQIASYIQNMNDSAMRINNLEAQGYRLDKCKNFEFFSDLNEQEQEIAGKFKKQTLRSASVMVIILIIVSIAVVIAAFTSSSGFNPPAMRYIVPAFICAVSLITIIVVLVRAFGPKKAARAIALAKTTRMSHGRNAQRLYFVIACQSSPNKIYAKDIPVTRKTYDEINNGDKVVIIKSMFGYSALKAD